ncbi:MAG: hypothetical protein AAGE43_18355, partial [Pseudomonadota bacterium]
TQPVPELSLKEALPAEFLAFVRFYEYATDCSEQGWAEFWSMGYDPATHMTMSLLVEVGAPAFAHYLKSVRFLDGSLAVLRGLKDIYRFETSPGYPARPAPAGWQWLWQDDTETLCLDPVEVHHTLSPASICLPYLTELIEKS